MKHIAVLMGGWSAERQVSLWSGTACADALEAKGYKVTRVDVARDIAGVLSALKPDVAFNALHGSYGEDGTMQGVLETLQIPYTHSGILASSLAMRKDRAKIVMQAAGVPVAEGLTVDRHEVSKRHVMSPPYVAKPVADGSSFGVFIVKDEHTPPPQALDAQDWTLADEILVERFVAGRELTCGVMGDSYKGSKALGVIEIQAASHEFYDFDAKYAKGGSIHILPAKIKPNIYLKVQEMAVKAHEALGCKGVSRSDFRYDDESDTLICMEVNTQPGMTSTSLVPDMAVHAGMSFGELVEWIALDASLNR
jgi:D-alanine-D-alanine ligase